MFSKKESVLVLQLPVFADGIQSNVGKYQVSLPDANSMVTAVDEYVARYNAWNNPATRTPGSLELKSAAKISALGICRVFYGLIQRNVGISDADKVLIGVMPMNNTRTPRPCAQTSPSVTIVASTPGALTAQFRDSTDLTRRGLAPGATMCQLFLHIGTDNAETFDPATCRFVGNFTRNPMVVVFNPADRGKQATLFARWGGKRNEFGQWSVPVSMTVAA